MSETAIKITLSSKKNRTDNNGLIWRTWKVLIQSVHNNFFLENYIDHVEYLLHPSFEDPRIGKGNTFVMQDVLTNSSCTTKKKKKKSVHKNLI
jgi:hypothetical protein